ncbi:MAG: SDR family oxidoreductase [Phycisphaerae bacterium]
MELFSLKGKTALVTGGSKGLGFALAKGLAEHGANVVIIARDANALQEAKTKIESSSQSQCRIFSFDLHDTSHIDIFFSEVVREAGPVDILVNCAGINKRGYAEEISPAVWQEVLQINLTATFALSQAFCRHRKSINIGGKIINIGSLMCQAARPSVAPYTVSKGGVLMLTKALAVEWAKYNINVNAIGPGYFDTEMTKQLQADEKFNNWVLSNTPLGRWGDPNDLVGVLVFLASHASDFVTGQIIYVDGGWLASL